MQAKRWWFGLLRGLLRSSSATKDIYRLSEESFEAGPNFEEFDPSIGIGRQPLTKVVAFYLPQFHQFEENDRNWGVGFTEWTNVARNIPRFPGHIAPRIPRDLGFYDLSIGDIQERQAKLA